MAQLKPVLTQRTEWGDVRVVVDGVDRTRDTVRGDVPIEPTMLEWTDGMGPSAGTIRIPIHDDHRAAPAWLTADARVDVWQSDGTHLVRRIWAGEVDTYAPTSDGGLDVVLTGLLAGPGREPEQHRQDGSPVDTGEYIADVLDSVPSRKWGPMIRTRTGVLSTRRGGAGSVLQAVTDLCAGSMALSGLDTVQWALDLDLDTLRPYLRPLTGRGDAYPYTHKQPGVEVDLPTLPGSRVTTVYGRGVDARGRAWMGSVYYTWHADDSPEYPYADENQTLSVGDTDAGTRNNGVTLLNRALRSYGAPTGGAFTSRTREAVKAFQRDRAGTQVDGVVGGQTWTAVFRVGFNAGGLAVERIPLAGITQCEPYARDQYGRRTGPNPAYDARRRRNAIDMQFGDNIPKGQATEYAKALLTREGTEPVTGTVTVSVGSIGGDFRDIRPGDRIPLGDYMGRTVVLYVSQVSWDPMADTVSCSVSTWPAAYVDWAETVRLKRESDTLRTLSRRGRPQTREEIPTSRMVLDGESPAGVIERHATFRNLPGLVGVPMGGSVTYNGMNLWAEASNTRILAALFNRPVTLADIQKALGGVAWSTLIADPDANTFEERADQLKEIGLVISWGSGQWWAGDKSRGSKLSDDGGWSWEAIATAYGGSAQTGYLLTLADKSTSLYGKFIPGPPEV
jgi:peptidoglycan hydrolase-like protein with peptidoglycan-binding domain